MNRNVNIANVIYVSNICPKGRKMKEEPYGYFQYIEYELLVSNFYDIEGPYSSKTRILLCCVCIDTIFKLIRAYLLMQKESTSKFVYLLENCRRTL